MDDAVSVANESSRCMLTREISETFGYHKITYVKTGLDGNVWKLSKNSKFIDPKNILQRSLSFLKAEIVSFEPDKRALVTCRLV